MTPTTLNRQGPDSGTSYRSAIFYTNDEQKKIGEAYIAQLEAAKVFPHKIVTEVTKSKGFYDAEAYHQDYATLHPGSAVYPDLRPPKVDTLKKDFPELFVEYKVK